MLQVFLETGGFLDGLAGILVFVSFGVTGIGHTSGSKLGWVVEEGEVAAGGNSGRGESRSSGEKGGKDDQFLRYKKRRGRESTPSN